MPRKPPHPLLQHLRSGAQRRGEPLWLDGVRVEAYQVERVLAHLGEVAPEWADAVSVLALPPYCNSRRQAAQARHLERVGIYRRAWRGLAWVSGTILNQATHEQHTDPHSA